MVVIYVMRILIVYLIYSLVYQSGVPVCCGENCTRYKYIDKLVFIILVSRRMAVPVKHVLRILLPYLMFREPPHTIELKCEVNYISIIYFNKFLIDV